ncbi:MAG: SDR family oxidoreductase [Candidatus Woesearchaeota archaeon]
MMELKNKIAIVTGGSRGLGAAMSECLAESGASVVICSNNQKELDGECRKISEKGRCFCYNVDVSQPEQVKGFISSVMKAHGRIDILINNAGVTHPKKPVEEISDEEYEKCLQVNTASVFYFLREAVPIMKKQCSGIIVNISSGAGKKGYPGLSIYSASKFAVQGLTESVAKEIEKTPVKCIAICPGGINTEMRASIFGKEDAERQQSPYAVAKIVRDIIVGKVSVPNGADVQVRNGEITGINDNLSL